MPWDVLSAGGLHSWLITLCSNKIALAIDHVKNIFVVMSWDVLSAGFFGCSQT